MNRVELSRKQLILSLLIGLALILIGVSTFALRAIPQSSADEIEDSALVVPDKGETAPDAELGTRGANARAVTNSGTYIPPNGTQFIVDNTVVGGAGRFSDPSIGSAGFCVNYNLGAPAYKQTFTTIDGSDSVVGLNAATRDQVSAVLHALSDASYSSLSQSQLESAILGAIWNFTNNRSTNNSTSLDIISKVNSGTYQAQPVIWLDPQDGTTQPLIALPGENRNADSCVADDYYADDFSNASYVNSDGTINWNALSWQERDTTSGTGNGAGSQPIQITGGELRMGDPVNEDQFPEIYRSVDLTSADSAQVSFDFNMPISVDYDDSIEFSVRTSGGAWQLLDTFAGLYSGSRSYDLSNYISDNTELKFQVKDNYGASDEYFAVDNFKVCRVQDTASLGEYVWADTNMNGLQDGNEDGIGSVEVNLYRVNPDGSTSFVDSETTDGTGYFLFENLPSDVEYFIEIVEPSGYAGFTTANQQGSGSSDNNDSDVNPDTGRSTPILLNSGEENLSLAAGLVPNSSCLPNITFDTNGNGQALASGAIPLEEWANLGIHVNSSDPANHAPMIFDSSNPSGGDTDLGSPHTSFSGPGVGVGGAAGQIAQNNQSVGNVLIISEDNDASDPDDNVGGGTLEFTFDSPQPVYGVQILDTDHGEVGGRIRAYDAAGNLLREASIIGYGNNSLQTVTVNAVNVSRLEVEFPGSGSVSALVFCEPNPPALVSLGDFVWYDLDGDGNQDTGESGINNVTVQLKDSDGNLLAEVQTDSAGRYLFPNLLPGTYQTEIVGDSLPSGLAATYDLDNDNDGNSGTVTLNAGDENLSLDFGYQPGNPPTSDFGDLPSNYPSASHTIVDDIYLGAGVDAEFGTQNSADADGDDSADGNDDEDGVRFLGIVNGQYAVEVDVFHNGTFNDVDLYGWIDFNGDGDFDDAGEQVIPETGFNRSATTQTQTFYYDIPADVEAGPTYARFRLSGNSNLPSSGNDSSGEVEDYLIVITADHGDLPAVYGDPSHVIVPGLQLGAANDAETETQYSNAANGDDNDGTDDEDGIVFVGAAPAPGDTNNQIQITALNTDYNNATVVGWIDFNGDGDFDDAGEQIVNQAIPQNANPQNVTVSYDVPVDAIGGPTNARFRIVDGTVNSTDPAAAGEVEDYILDIDTGDLAAIGDYVWYDTNADGIQDVDEVGIPNVTLDLYRDNGDGVFDPNTDILVDTQTTDGNGGYLFTGLPAATYFVDVTDTNNDLAGLTHTLGAQSMTDASPAITVEAGDTFLDADFGYVQEPTDPNNAFVGDTVWFDDGDGVQQPDEIGIAGVTINVRNGSGQIVGTAVTDQFGNYLIELPAGTYTVEVDPSTLPAGLTQTYDLDGTLDHSTPITLAAGETRLDADFGYTSPNLGSIGNQVWIDDNDGTYENGEAVVPGVTINLINDLNGNGTQESGEPVVATSVTDENGRYLFPALPAGDYIVQIGDVTHVLEGFEAVIGSNPGQDNNSQGNMYPIALGVGEDNQTGDLGFVAEDPAGDKGIIGNQIWYETDSNGVFDEGEVGIAGVRVLLLNSAGELLDETITGSAGTYAFTELPAGDYQVIVSDTVGVLDAYVPTVFGPNQGSDNNNQVQAYSISLPSGGINMTGDFGYTDPSYGLGNYVWTDENFNGMQDEGLEFAIADAPVELYFDSNGNGSLDSADVKVDDTLTDVTGAYRFDGLGPGTYFAVIPMSAAMPPSGLPELINGPTISNAGFDGSTPVEDMPNDSNGTINPAFGIVSGPINLIGDEVDENGTFNSTVDFGFVKPSDTTAVEMSNADTTSQLSISLVIAGGLLLAVTCLAAWRRSARA